MPRAGRPGPYCNPEAGVQTALYPICQTGWPNVIHSSSCSNFLTAVLSIHIIMVTRALGHCFALDSAPSATSVKLINLIRPLKPQGAFWSQRMTYRPVMPTARKCTICSGYGLRYQCRRSTVGPLAQRRRPRAQHECAPVPILNLAPIRGQTRCLHPAWSSVILQVPGPPTCICASVDIKSSRR